jgi:hypothetical protein
MEIIQFLQNIDWLFAAVLLIGGRYWGQRYFRITKNNDFNFLAFATLFGGAWLLIKKVSGTLNQLDFGNLFLTYLFTTSFYQLLAKKLFEWVEQKFKTMSNLWLGIIIGLAVGALAPAAVRWAKRQWFND